MPGLDEQEVWEKMNKGLVGGRTEMTGKAIESRLESHGGGTGGGRPGRVLGPRH